MFNIGANNYFSINKFDNKEFPKHVETFQKSTFVSTSINKNYVKEMKISNKTIKVQKMKSLLENYFDSSESSQYQLVESKKIDINNTLEKINENKYKDYKNDLILFNQSYNTTNKFINKQELPKIKEFYERLLKKYLSEIENQTYKLFSKEHGLMYNETWGEILYNDIDEQLDFVYNSLRVNYIILIINSVNELSKEETDNVKINDLLKLIEIKPAYSDSNEISVHVIMFEFIFGLLLRNDQLELSYKIENEIMDPKKQINIYQMLMGKGKTSVISPLLTILLLHNPNRTGSIFHIMPESIVNQSYANMINTIGNLYEIPISGPKYERGSFDIVPLQTDGEIFIMSDTSIKSLKLNYFLEKREGKEVIDVSGFNKLVNKNTFII